MNFLGFSYVSEIYAILDLIGAIQVFTMGKLYVGLAQSLNASVK